MPYFEAESGLGVRVIAVGTGKALRMGRDGDIDMLMVHAKPAELAFVDSGFGLRRHELMYNDFVIVGPLENPAGLVDSGTLRAAIQGLARTDSVFLSRGDDSGTHKKELQLWASIGVKPKISNYRETGQGMGKTLQIASELEAYTMVDRGTWLILPGGSIDAHCVSRRCRTIESVFCDTCQSGSLSPAQYPRGSAPN